MREQRRATTCRECNGSLSQEHQKTYGGVLQATLKGFEPPWCTQEPATATALELIIRQQEEAKEGAMPTGQMLALYYILIIIFYYTHEPVDTMARKMKKGLCRPCNRCYAYTVDVSQMLRN